MWVYFGQSGSIYSDDGAVVATGYSGCGAGLNNPSMSNVPDVGPIPDGTYTMGPWFNDPEKGPIVTRLIPDPANEMYGRSGFMIHGDNPQMNHTASEGCIVLPHWVRLAMSESDVQQLEVN